MSDRTTHRTRPDTTPRPTPEAAPAPAPVSAPAPLAAPAFPRRRVLGGRVPGGRVLESLAPGAGRRPVRGLRRAALGALALSLLVPLAAGCGIRATSVPVDAGAAPSRVGCVLPDDHESPEGGGGASVVRVYLVCGARVSPVERKVRMPGGRSSARRLPVARKLLDELRQRPEPAEDTAGFETAVPRRLTVSGGTDGDPDEALRLSEPLEELPPYALAQIVCTYAVTSAADAEGGVVLGGPAGGRATGGDDAVSEAEGADGGARSPLRRYECGTSLRTHPRSAESAGTQV
ncbi:hypothetical protein AB0939_29870 [Streptomyces sp. NPDC006990]|uniref:hypothetical protein n=1 Tax=unclassified Streptomyces TaxID=2593676 RepID=UPI003451C6AC